MNEDKDMKKFSATIPFVILFMLLSLFVITIMAKKEKNNVLTYSEFLRVALPEMGPSPIKKVIITNDSDNAIVIFPDNTERIVRIPNSDGKALKDLADKLVNKSVEVEIKEREQASVIWSLNTLYHFCSRIFSGLVPVCAEISFFKSPTVSSGLHFTRIFFPRRSLHMTSIIFRVEFFA